jgi:hypothetical protein
MDYSILKIQTYQIGIKNIYMQVENINASKSENLSAETPQAASPSRGNDITSPSSIPTVADIFWTNTLFNDQDNYYSREIDTMFMEDEKTNMNIFES